MLSLRTGSGLALLFTAVAVCAPAGLDSAYAALQAKDYDEAIAEFREVLKTDPCEPRRSLDRS